MGSFNRRAVLLSNVRFLPRPLAADSARRFGGAAKEKIPAPPRLRALAAALRGWIGALVVMDAPEATRPDVRVHRLLVMPGAGA